MRPRFIPSYVIPLLTIGVALAAGGCGKDQPVSPGVQPQVVNIVDSFEFQVSAVQNFTGIWKYDWTTTGTIVNVDQSSAVTGGTVTLRLLDSAGQTVYTRNLAESGSFTTSAGATGMWRLEIVLTKASGTLNFRTQKNQ